MSVEKAASEKREHASTTSIGSDIDLLSYHEKNAGRLIIDPEEAKVELGEHVASRLKLTPDGTIVLWPQPTDSPLDPQNWSDRRKTIQLITITLAAIVPDFDSGIGELRWHLSIGALIMGWGIAELAVMINTVTVYAYCLFFLVVPALQIRGRRLREHFSMD